MVEYLRTAPYFLCCAVVVCVIRVGTVKKITNDKTTTTTTTHMFVGTVEIVIAGLSGRNKTTLLTSSSSRARAVVVCELVPYVRSCPVRVCVCVFVCMYLTTFSGRAKSTPRARLFALVQHRRKHGMHTTHMRFKTELKLTYE